MLRDKKGQIMISIIVAVMIFMVGVMISGLMQPSVTTFRADLDCTNSTITDGAKAACLVGDIALPYFIITFISIAGGIITNRFLT